MAANSTVIQHVTKKSSDELLKKFAELEDDEAKKDQLKLSTRRKIRSKVKRTRRESSGVGEHCYNNYSICESPSHYSTLLLPPAVARKSVLLRQLRARDFKNKSFFITIEKTWRKTLEGATKILLEKHYNRHRRLVSDVV